MHISKKKNPGGEQSIASGSWFIWSSGWTASLVSNRVWGFRASRQNKEQEAPVQTLLIPRVSGTPPSWGSGPSGRQWWRSQRAETTVPFLPDSSLPYLSPTPEPESDAQTPSWKSQGVAFFLFPYWFLWGGGKVQKTSPQNMTKSFVASKGLLLFCSNSLIPKT